METRDPDAEAAAPSRRAFLAAAGACTAAFFGLRLLLTSGRRAAHATAGDLDRAAVAPGAAAGFGPLLEDPAGLVDLPRGFRYVAFSAVGDAMDDGFVVPGAHDGMAAFAGPNGRVLLVRNHELLPGNAAAGPFGRNHEGLRRVPASKIFDRGRGRAPCVGGTTTLVFDPERGALVAQWLSLVGTIRNCAGGPTPWGSWISCEETDFRAGSVLEHDHGWCFEVPARAEPGLCDPIPLKAMGRFNHEAVAVELGTGAVLQTEDRDDGLLYRFVPDHPGRLADGGRLQALALSDRRGADTRNWRADSTIEVGAPLAAHWIDVRDVESPRDDLRAQGHAAGAARFARGEGMWAGADGIYFACTTGGRGRKGQIWRYTPGADPVRGTLTLFCEPNDASLLDHADNLTVAPHGDLVVCEDGSGAQRLVGITPQGACYPLARNARNGSELAGATFSPDGRWLFFNIQNPGLTIAITGPFAARRTG